MSEGIKILIAEDNALLRGVLRDALEDANWNVADVARRLDLVRSHVYNLIRAFGLARES